MSKEANIDCAIDAIEDAIELRRQQKYLSDEGLVWALRILKHVQAERKANEQE